MMQKYTATANNMMFWGEQYDSEQGTAGPYGRLEALLTNFIGFSPHVHTVSTGSPRRTRAPRDDLLQS